jgi:hypothetical protein
LFPARSTDAATQMASSIPTDHVGGPHNAPLHLFSADPELVAFAQGVYRPLSDQTSLVLGKLFDRLEEEGFTMSYTMQDFTRDYLREKLEQLSSKDRKQLLRSLPPEERLAGLSSQQIRRYLDQLSAGRPSKPRKPRRKK